MTSVATIHIVGWFGYVIRNYNLYGVGFDQEVVVKLYWEHASPTTKFNSLPKCEFFHTMYDVYLKLHYNILHISQDLTVGVSKLNMSWTTTAHRCLFHTMTYLLEDVERIKGTATNTTMQIKWHYVTDIIFMKFGS